MTINEYENISKSELEIETRWDSINECHYMYILHKPTNISIKHEVMENFEFSKGYILALLENEIILKYPSKGK
jgi:hypothetical protein